MPSTSGLITILDLLYKLDWTVVHWNPNHFRRRSYSRLPYVVLTHLIITLSRQTRSHDSKMCCKGMATGIRLSTVPERRRRLTTKERCYDRRRSIICLHTRWTCSPKSYVDSVRSRCRSWPRRSWHVNNRSDRFRCPSTDPGSIDSHYDCLSTRATGTCYRETSAALELNHSGSRFVFFF